MSKLPEKSRGSNLGEKGGAVLHGRHWFSVKAVGILLPVDGLIVMAIDLKRREL